MFSLRFQGHYVQFLDFRGIKFSFNFSGHSIQLNLLREKWCIMLNSTIPVGIIYRSIIPRGIMFSLIITRT